MAYFKLFLYLDFTVALADEAITNLLEFKLKCLYRRALCYFDIKKFDEAIKDCQDLLRIDVNNILARSLLGRAYKVLFQYQKAEEQLCDAIYLDKAQANLYIGKNRIFLFFFVKPILFLSF